MWTAIDNTFAIMRASITFLQHVAAATCAAGVEQRFVRNPL
jgi:hypothetical protein